MGGAFVALGTGCRAVAEVGGLQLAGAAYRLPDPSERTCIYAVR
jgi:hypothetical protein